MNRNKQPRQTMAEIQRRVADEITLSGVATTSIAEHLTGLRTSGAAGRHIQGERGNRTRKDQRNNAIRNSLEN